MSTRSWIAKEEKDGKVTQIYCHWDGYPSHHGEILCNNYAEEEQVNALMELGDLESLKETIADTKTAKEDCGEDWEDCKPKEFDDLEDCVRSAINQYPIEFLYVYRQNPVYEVWGWYCYDLHQIRKTLPNLCISL